MKSSITIRNYSSLFVYWLRWRWLIPLGSALAHLNRDLPVKKIACVLKNSLCTQNELLITSLSREHSKTPADSVLYCYIYMTCLTMYAYALFLPQLHIVHSLANLPVPKACEREKGLAVLGFMYEVWLLNVLLDKESLRACDISPVSRHISYPIAMRWSRDIFLSRSHVAALISPCPLSLCHRYPWVFFSQKFGSLIFIISFIEANDYIAISVGWRLLAVLWNLSGCCVLPSSGEVTLLDCSQSQLWLSLL